MNFEATSSLIPKHVAIIMDGNGRWAESRGRPRLFGHVRGASRVKPIVKAADRLGVKALTLFAFSTENWLRPKEEVDILWRLMNKFLIRETKELHSRNVRLRTIGDRDRLPAELRETIERSVEKLKNNTGLQLTLAVSYGAQKEIVLAAQKFAKECLEGKRTVDSLNEDTFEQYLTTETLGDLADVDLLIRTSGEQRISNFLLWQSAYAEFAFTEVCWPEFSDEHFEQMVRDFGYRDRRFGGIHVTPLTTDFSNRINEKQIRTH